MPRPAYYLSLAKAVSLASKDGTQVGAILVGEGGALRATGYNGPPIGVRDAPERFERPTKYLYASHAEMNIIAFCARAGVKTEGCALYVTHLPCSICTRLLIQAGISDVFFGGGSTSIPAEDAEAARAMAAEAGLSFIKLE